MKWSRSNEKDQNPGQEEVPYRLAVLSKMGITETMQRKKPPTMLAPPEVLCSPTLRAQFIHKHGRIPVAPGHWSLLQPTSAASTELPHVAETGPLQTSLCANCSSPLPAKRSKYCSDPCSDDAKRKNARKAYGHRHRFMCVECGCELRPGRRRR